METNLQNYFQKNLVEAVDNMFAALSLSGMAGVLESLLFYAANPEEAKELTPEDKLGYHTDCLTIISQLSKVYERLVSATTNKEAA